ncbi:MAG: 2Fe-2S iron-sulfur cluster-binding protein [Deferribacterales bacterium]
MFLSRKYKVTVTNKNTVLEVKHGANLYSVLREHELIEKMLCDGSSQCGKCKVKISGNDVNKPTKKERLVLAETSIESGMRLACQYTVKSDIKVDTQEAAKRENVNPGIVSMKIVKSNGEVEENEFKSYLHSDMFIKPDLPASNEPIHVPEDQEPELIVDDSVDDDDFVLRETFEELPQEPVTPRFMQEEEPVQQPIHNADEPETPTQEPLKDDSIKITSRASAPAYEDDSYSNDGLLLVQQPDGIQYFHYSAGIANLASKGMIKTDERIEVLLEKHLLSDFIYNNINVKDVERVIVMLDDCYFEGKELFNLVIYTSINIGGFLIEILQPMQNHRDMVRFLRFVNQTPGKRLLIPLDSLEKAYFLDDGNLYELEAGYIDSDSLLSMSEFNGKNPIVGLSDDMLETTVKDSFHLPDSISFTVFFHTAVIFMKTGLADKRLQLKDRTAVMDLMPLEITVKLGKHDGLKRFNVFRKQGCDLYIDQNALDALNRFRLFIRTVIAYTEKKFGNIDNIVFYTLTDSATLADDLLTLSAVPKKYERRLKTFSGDPSIFAVQFFQERDIETYFQKRFGVHEIISLDSDEVFTETQKECELKIIS